VAPFLSIAEIASNALSLFRLASFLSLWQTTWPSFYRAAMIAIKNHQAAPHRRFRDNFHQHLRESGKRQIMRSPRHSLDTGVVLEAPQHGGDVHLTIDHFLQAVAEEEICKAVKRANAKSGWAIMMEPHTGEILALAQYPWFTPGNYRKFFNDIKLSDNTQVHAVTDPYEPGSTFKPFTIAIGLLANIEMQKQGKKPLFSVNEKIATTPRSFRGRSKPIKDLHTYRFLNMYMGIQKSSNVYMSSIIERVVEAMGPAWYRSCLHDIFGFGTKTEVEIPGESAGLLPQLGKRYPSGALEWSSLTPYSLAMGHNVLANSMQMVRAYGILANGGFSVQPTLIRRITVKNKMGNERDCRLCCRSKEK
jgi:cell division protein FtsI (penicillin-binding protein 3)